MNISNTYMRKCVCVRKRVCGCVGLGGCVPVWVCEWIVGVWVCKSKRREEKRRVEKRKRKRECDLNPPKDNF